LGAYLPGPLNVVKDVLLTKQDEPQVGHDHAAACNVSCAISCLSSCCACMSLTDSN
jgi:hypothetical protein